MNRTLAKVFAGLTIALIVYWMGFPIGGRRPDEGRVAVSGSVTYQGKPVENGIISFTPAKETNGFAAGGRIKGGNYSIPTAEGPSAGRYRVQIMVGMPQRLRSEKNPSFQNIGVVVDGKGRHDFDLPPD